MAFLPPVVARLSMDLGDFDAKLDEAKAKIHSLGDTVHIKMDVDNSQLRQMAQDTEAMHRMMGRDQAIRERVNLDDSDAKVRLAELTRDRSVRVRVDVDKSKLDQAEGFFSKMGSLLGGGHSFNLPFTNMTANPIGLAAIGGAIAALLPELAGVVSGFAAAGAGAVAFGILAAPAVKHVTTAYSNLKAAQLAYNNAKEKEQLDPSKANASALVKAADNLKLVQEQIGKMPAAEQAAITGITNLSAAFGKQSKAFEPKVFEVFASGLRLAATLLPTITPFANTFADSLSKIFSNLDKSAKGKGFQDFLKQFHSIEGPAVNAIAAGIGNVAGSIGRLLTVMSGKDVAHTLNIAFSAISGTIGGITSTIRTLMTLWDGMGLALHNVASSFDQVRHAAASVGHDIASAFDNVRHGLADIGTSIIHAFTGVPGSIAHIASQMADPFKSVPGKIKGFFAGAAGWLTSAGIQVVAGFESAAKSAWGKASAWFGSLSGLIKGFFGGAGGWLTNAGQAIMSGLLSGIESAWNKVASFLSSLAGKIKSLKGPLDYDRVMLYPHGQAIMQGLMGGMQSRVPALESQLRGITNSIAGIAGNSHAALAGGANQPIYIEVKLDGRQVYSAMQQQAISTQRNTGQTGLTKRTR